MDSDDLNSKCSDVIAELYIKLNNMSNQQENARLVYDFAIAYNLIVSDLSENTMKIVVDYPNYYKNIQNNDITNTNKFLINLSNNVTINVINMVINIAHHMRNNGLNSKLMTIFRDNISHCIEDIIQSANNVIVSLTTEDNPLDKVFGSNSEVKSMIIKSITDGVDKLNILKQQYNLY